MSRLTAAAALIIAVGVAAPATAQPAELTRQEYYKLATILAEDTDLLGDLVSAIGELPPENHDVVVDYMRRTLLDRDYVDALYDRFGGELDENATFVDSFEDGLLFGAEIAIDGVLRLPLADQQRYLDFIRYTIDLLIETDPGLCVSLADPSLSPSEYVAVDLLAYSTMAPEDLRELLSLYERAVAAELGAEAPAVRFTNSELDDGEAALEVAALALLEDTPLIARIEAANDLDDISAADLCSLSLVVIDAFDTLPEPERSWAMRAVLAGAL